MAFGNYVVLKPADWCRDARGWVAEIIHRSGVPAGAFNLLTGRGRELCPILAGAGVDALSFTGSTKVGAAILKSAAEHNIRVQLEMEGKNPLIVLETRISKSHWTLPARVPSVQPGSVALLRRA